MATTPQQLHLTTALPGPKSQSLDERRKASISAAVGTTMPVYAASADRGVIVDVDGNTLVDMGSGIAVTTVGAASPRVIKAVQDAVAQFTHTCFMVTPYESYIAVGEMLNRITPGNFAKKTALFNSGAEAVENAVKIARYHTGKQAVVAFDHAYHGRTNLTMALTAKSMPYKSGFGPFASEIYRVSGSYPLRDGLTGAQAAAKAIHSIEKQIGAGNLAAVIIEPIQGEGGFVVPADGFLPAIVEWCRANNVVFIADEVQSGFARTGKMFASEHFGIEPDLVVSAKGIAGGLPLSAVTGRAEIMDAPHIGGLGGTYVGNPIACAAALAVIQDIEEDDMLGKAQAIEKIMLEKLGVLKAKDSRIAEVRGKGAMIALEIVDGAGKPDAVFTGKLAGALKAKGIIVLTCGTDGNIVRFLPPLTMPLELLEATLETIDVTMSTL